MRESAKELKKLIRILLTAEILTCFATVIVTVCEIYQAGFTLFKYANSTLRARCSLKTKVTIESISEKVDKTRSSVQEKKIGLLHLTSTLTLIQIRISLLDFSLAESQKQNSTY